MKKIKNLILLIGLFIITSCNGRTDLETLKYNEKIAFVDNLEKDFSLYVPLEGIYRVKKINKFKLFGISLKDDSIKFKNEGATYSNILNIVVDSYKENKYLGFELEIIDEKLGNDFFEILKKRYGKPLKKYEYKDDKNIVIDYLWQNKSTNQIVLFKKNAEDGHTSLNGGEAILHQTRIIILKDGLSAKPDEKNPRNTQEKVDALLKSNPKAFDILEIFKSQIQD
ncbi:hypothetical protein [Chryseobacterium turcicum]|uniref:Lipoprotein n=1 Tax=Chryseobacterium turcicum TaxID=2898076 RepID=A0A9Q3V2Y3_9FLAO|nr:hypothetical protein [Chryseobacterium turcicum]MCD1118638.1 hypothetical protein [Chryseobacterium turcicum]